MIAADLLTTLPMQASASPEPVARTLSRSELIFDVKWDGIRALLYVDEGKAKIRNRNGADISHRYPEIIATAEQAYPSGSRVFDGELVVCNPQTGKFEFPLALSRDAQSNPRKIATAARTRPATYVAFDLLWVDDTNLRNRPLRERLLMLAGEELGGLQRSQSSTDGSVMWAAVQMFGFEGLVAKEASSLYRPGNSGRWTKLKSKKRLTAIVTDFEYGEGSRADQVGALFLSLLKDGELVRVGKVGTGFKQADHGPLLSVLRAGHEFLVEIEYLEATRDLQLRQPSYKGVRSDVDRSACTVAQLKREEAS